MSMLIIGNVGVIKSIFVVLLACSSLYSANLDCKDYDMVLCMDLSEGDGLVTRDNSGSQLTGTLAGGPAWVRGDTAGRALWDRSMSSTNTYTLMPPHYIQFTRTLGEEVTTQATPIGDFSGNKPGMLAFVIKRSDILSVGRSNEGIWGWGINSCGWKIEDHGAGGGGINIQVSFVINLEFKSPAAATNKIGDLNPHSYLAWWDGQGNFMFFVDGKLTRTTSGVGDFITCSGVDRYFSFAKSHSAGGTEWGGGVTYARVWKTIVPRDAAEGFAKAYHFMYLGAE